MRSEEQRGIDRALMDLVAKGDASAFGQLYDRLAPPLFAFILQMLRDRQEAEDVLQETCVLLWKKVNQYQPEQSSVFTWAVTLARGKAIDRLRSRQRRSRVFENATEPKTEPSVKPEIAISGERTFLNETLQELPDEQREAIDLAFFNGLTHEEISSQLSQPLGTIKARIRRGLLKLRETFNQTP